MPLRLSPTLPRTINTPQRQSWCATGVPHSWMHLAMTLLMLLSACASTTPAPKGEANAVPMVSSEIAQSDINRMATLGMRDNLDSLMRLAGHDRPEGPQVTVAVQNNVNIDLSQLADRLINKFDCEPELKARIAQALVEIDDDQQAA